MAVIFTTTDWFCLGWGIVGTLLCAYSLYLNDWDLEKTLFRHTSDDE